MLAATNVDFCQKTVSTREKFLEMAGGQLPFGQLPLLQIDGMEIVQSQAAVRYLARRAHLAGTSAQDALKCDMIAEAARDVLSLLLACPFRKYSGNKAAADGASSSSSAPSEEWVAHQATIKEKWRFVGARFEAILRNNLPASHPALAALAPAVPAAGASGAAQKAPAARPPAAAASAEEVPVHIVGSSLTYADVLVAHLITWLVEECGSGVVADMPLLVQLQNQVISLPGIKRFIRSVNYFPVGDRAYVEQVSR
jgi:glutathione S-transferase